VRIQSEPDGYDGDGDGDGDGHGDSESVMVMVTVMVPKALSQVDWLRQHQCQSFNSLKVFYWPKLPLENSTPPEAWLCQALLSRAGFQAGSQADSQGPAGCKVDSQ